MNDPTRTLDGRTDFLVHDEPYLAHPAAGAHLGDGDTLTKVLHFDGKAYACLSISEGNFGLWQHLEPEAARRLARALLAAANLAELAAAAAGETA